MCFRFLQVTWSFLKTGELPHHDHGHVDGLDETKFCRSMSTSMRMDDNLHMHDLKHHGQTRPKAKQEGGETK
jgi:C4-dicarboxylate transporter DctQ subunit